MKKLFNGILALMLIMSMSVSSFAAGFTDVPADSEESEAITWCKDNGIMAGTSSTTFSPDSTMTRAMLATVLYRASGSPAVNHVDNYTDTIAGSWYEKALVWVADAGLMQEYGNRTFGPNEPVSREQVATVIWRQQESPATSKTVELSDRESIAAYALPAVQWVISEEIMDLSDTDNFEPNEDACRGDVAVALFRTLTSDNESARPLPLPDETTSQNHSDGNSGSYNPALTPTPSTSSPSESDSTKQETDSSNLQTTIYNLNGVDLTMVYVEAGTFTMGSDDSRVAYSESPAHQVTLTKDYLMGETEVTEALWNAVMGNGGGSNSMPKTSVTWGQAHSFIDNLNVIMHEQGLISEDVHFILPTEAQWEFAAKGGNLSKGYKYSGSNNINDVAVTYENSGSSSPIQVKSKAANEIGIYDMSGNAYEWVDDYGGNYSSGFQTNPQNTSGSSYVKRGGSNYHSFSSEPYLFTTTGRYFYSSTDWTIGFRIALESLN